MLTEIRNYHFDATHFDAYRIWAAEKAVPYLKSRMDVVGFWVSDGSDPEYGGLKKARGAAEPPNITWVIRWPDRATRDAAWKELRASAEWKAILADVPGGWRSYIRTEARFANEIDPPSQPE